MSAVLQLFVSPQAIELKSAEGAKPSLGQIEVGYAPLTQLFFQGETISAGRLEQAIEWTEDQIQSAKLSIPPGSALHTHEQDLRELAVASGVAPSADMALHVDAVEATFSRLVMQAFGQAPQQESLPRSARFFATVVFVRELMHHLHFPVIHVLGNDEALTAA